MLLYTFSVILNVVLLAYGQRSTVQTFFPASIPLAVRTPYLSTWHNAADGQSPLSVSSPVFWTQKEVMEWTGSIRVDNISYSWLGLNAPRTNPTLVIHPTNMQITPTRSIYVMTAGPMNVTVTFLSPIEPSDLVKQSMPFSYVSVEAFSLDGAAHSVQIYSDISTEWASGNRGQDIPTWKGGQVVGSSIYHQISIVNPEGTETNDQMSDGTLYYAMPEGPDVTWQVDDQITARHRFINNGTLTNTPATPGSASILSGLTVVAFSIDLHDITGTANPVTWSVGYVRDPSIVFQNASGIVETRRQYFFTQYSTIGLAIDAFVQDFSAALDRAQSLDENIINDAGKISSNYVDLVSLAARQVMGSMDITVLQSNGGGSLNESDVKIFIKDIGGDTTGRVNAVERIYQALPAYLYFNASLLSGILKPMLESQDTLTRGSYPFPSAGRANDGTTGIDNAGTMLIVMYAHARFSGDSSLLIQHYVLAKHWADYLVQTVSTSNEFENQIPTDQLTRNSTNLYLKGVIGIRAMAEISRVTGNDGDMQTYERNASNLMDQWLSTGLASDGKQILGTFGDSSSWSLAWNLYADLLLGTNLVPTSVLDGHTKYLGTRLVSGPNFGLAEDSTEPVKASTASLLFTAAAVTDPNVRDMLTQGVWNRANSNTTIGALLDIYNNNGTGTLPANGAAGSTVGSMFSHLALTLSNQIISNQTTGLQPQLPPNGLGNGTPRSNTRIIVGGVLGGAVVTATAVAAVIFFVRRRRRAVRLGYADQTLFVTEAMRGRPPSLSQMTRTQETGSASTSRFYSGSSRSPSSHSKGSLGAAATVAASWHPVEIASPQVLPARLDAGSDYDASTAIHSIPETDDVVGLRAEVQDLRRVMERIRQERSEPPPVYQEDQGF